MSYSFNNTNEAPAFTAEDIATYLSANPDFFKQNPAILEALQLSHDTSDNVESLIERQVSVLREKNAQLELTLLKHEKLLACRHHLQQHVYTLALEILRCDSLEDLSRLLQLSMNKWFASSHVRVFVFNSHWQAQQSGNIITTGKNFTVEDMFSGLLNRKKPLCSSLQIEHLQTLFGRDAEKIRSNVVIPLYSDAWNGLFVLGSASWDQYGQGEELDMLVFLGELISYRLGVLAAETLSGR